MPHDIGKTLKKCRNDANMSVKAISDLLTKKGFKASESTIYSWENGNSQPTPGALLTMCEAYNVDDILTTFGYDGYNEDGTLRLDMYEIDMIEKYRFISEHSPAGAETVDYILNREYNVANQLKEDRPDLTITQHDIRTIQYYQRPASAGSGEYLFDDIPTDTITVENTPISSEADFVIGVNGQSMEPTYYDGDLVFVKKAAKISVGEIGIFTKGSECFIKELGPDRLISHNADKARYPDVFPDEEIRLVGLVLGNAQKV